MNWAILPLHLISGIKSPCPFTYNNLTSNNSVACTSVYQEFSPSYHNMQIVVHSQLWWPLSFPHFEKNCPSPTTLPYVFKDVISTFLRLYLYKLLQNNGCGNIIEVAIDVSLEPRIRTMLNGIALQNLLISNTSPKPIIAFSQWSMSRDKQCKSKVTWG